MEVTTRIIKGGALLDDSRRFVDSWDESRPLGDNLQTFRSQNLLGKRSRSRAEATLAILRQRLVEPGPEILSALKSLTMRPDAFRAACYYEAARSDDLLAYTAGEILYGLRGRGWVKVTVDDVGSPWFRVSVTLCWLVTPLPERSRGPGYDVGSCPGW